MGRLRDTMPPWATIPALAFMRDVVKEAGDQEPQGATLTMRRRPEVMTRWWYELSWCGADGKRHSVSASDMMLLMERAAEAEIKARALVAGEWEG